MTGAVLSRGAGRRMKTLTAQADAARRTAGTRSRSTCSTLTLYRDQFGPTPVATTFYLSDRARTELGQTWLPAGAILGHGGRCARAARGRRLASAPSTSCCSIRCAIDTPTVSAARFSDLIRAGLNGGDQTYDIGFGGGDPDAAVSSGGATGDQVALFGLRCEEVTDLTEATCVLRMTGRELSLEDAEDLYRVSTQDFPLCDPDAVGDADPDRHRGRRRTRPASGWSSGIVHKLAADVPATPLATIPVSDADARRPDAAQRHAPDRRGAVHLHRPEHHRHDVHRDHPGGVRHDGGRAHPRGAGVPGASEYVYAFAANPGATHQTSAVPRLRSDGALVAAGTLHDRAEQHDR